MIHIVTDFGQQGPYMGELRAALRRAAPEVPHIDLMTDAPAFRPDLAACLLAALAGTARRGHVLLAVVDPGVGGPRRPLAIEADGRWLVGPDNGLFELVLRRAARVAGHEIVWRPQRLSASFHGRDLFAPVAARLARGDRLGLRAAEPARFPQWLDDLPAIVHVDGYGNLVTGLRAATIGAGTRLELAGRTVARARTFGDVPAGELFWYENSSGLAEVAANGACAAAQLGVAVGDAVRIAV